MKYILPLEKKKQLYHFENSSDGNELKKNNIIPKLNKDNKLKNGVVYVESKFQNNKYFELDKYPKKSQEIWKELLIELATKIGAINIKATLIKNENQSQTLKTKTDINISRSGKHSDIVDATLDLDYSGNSNHSLNKEIKSFFEFNLLLQGKADTVENVEKWLNENKISLENNFILRILFDNFKRNNLKPYREVIDIEEITSGIDELNNTFKALSNIESPLYSSSMSASFKYSRNRDLIFSDYKKLKIEINIEF